jgi:ABC-type polar amino acid transport system ATPase subunit
MAKSLSKSYGALEIFAGVDLAIDRGSKVVVPTGGDDCKGACMNLAQLQCPEASDDGDGCVITCEKVMKTRIILFDPKCVANANSVGSVRKCPNLSCEQ